MGLQIQFIDPNYVDPAFPSNKPVRRETPRFRLRSEAGVWIGPEVNFLPVRELPLISRVEVRVTGKPDVVASRLQTGYFSRSFAKPVQLGSARAWGSGRITNPDPLPAATVCELHVTVAFFDATADGRPVGAEKTVTAVCLLFTGAPPETPPELTVRNQNLQVLVGEPSSQVVTVRHPTTDTPKMSLAYPTTLAASDDTDARLDPVLAELTTALQTILSRTPSRDETNPLAYDFRWAFDLQLPDHARAALAELDGGLTIPVDVSLPNAKPIRWLLRLEAQSKPFPGFVVIDFGTTNSAVTLSASWDYVPFEGLPDDQEDFLRRELADWLRKGSVEAFGEVGKQFKNEWNTWRSSATGGLNAGSPENLGDWLRADPAPRLHALIAGLETTLRRQPEAFRRIAYAGLSHFYAASLRVPPLQRFKMLPAKLDPDTKAETVASEIEIKAVATRKGYPDDLWPEIVMGRSAQKGRLEAIGRGDEVPLEQILGRFHPSPKRYFGRRHPGFDVTLAGRTDHVSVDQLMRAGWEKLLAFADRARKDDSRLTGEPFRRAVITYPTVAPPSVRQTIQKLIKDLKIADVRTDYDEAIASAIFYIMREYNTYPELGLESFKARSRIRTDAGWAQNVLVFDIGGGTTDVALIRLTLTEEAVFAPGVDRGAGGRYYKITPKILSSTGHLQLGGELMTLRVFLLLKAAIVDRLLTLVQEGKISCDSVKSLLDRGGLPEEATQNGKYQPAWLSKAVRNENQDTPTNRLRDALNLAEAVLPTRWAEVASGRAARLQTFYALWDYAEKAKITLAGKGKPGSDPKAARDPFVLGPKDLGQLLDQAEIPHTLKEAKAFEVRLDVEQVETAIRKVVKEAVSLAKGALERLPEKETLDWLILSGQSCNLNLVDHELRESLQNPEGKEAPRFVWNPSRVTFLPEYAKLSTAIGACYAENQRRNRFAPSESMGDLRRGLNVLSFDINNLFSYLPAAFTLDKKGEGTRRLFDAGQELFSLDGVDGQDTQRALARTEWFGAALAVEVQRNNPGGGRTPWVMFDAQELANQLELSENQWGDQVQYQFEVDHRQSFELLLFRRDKDHPGPRYRLTGSEPRLDLAAEVAKATQRLGTTPKAPPTPGTVVIPPLFDADGILQWSIGLGTGERPTRLAVFEAGQQLGPWFHPEGKDGQSARGVISKDYAEEFMDGATVAVWGRPKGSETWSAFGRLERPGPRPVFRRKYRLTIDEKGCLRIHNGEPRYLESPDPQCLKEQPGWVYRRTLDPVKGEAGEERNPFTGNH